MSRHARIIQLTDTHLFANKEQKLLGINTFNAYNTVLAQALQDNQEQLDLLLLTGDLAQDKSVGAYQAISHGLRACPAKVACIPGNHDNDNFMKQHITSPHLTQQRIIEFEHWAVILLNSHWAEHVEGYIDNQQLNQLEQQITTLSDKFILIAMHHHILHVDSAWLDRLKLYNASDLFDVIEAHKNVKIITSGHVHQESLQTRKSHIFLTTPSTCFQFKPNQRDFALDLKPPGYRWFNLYDDGYFETGVIRVPIEDTPDISQKIY